MIKTEKEKTIIPEDRIEVIDKNEIAEIEDSKDSIIKKVVGDMLSSEKDDKFSHPVKICGQKLYLDEKSVRKSATKLARSISEHNIHMSKTLFYIHAGKLYKKWDYPSMKDYIEQELNISKRTCHYYIDIYSILILQFDMTPQEIENIGWSKIKELPSLAKKGILNKNNLSRWVSDAKHLTHAELMEKIKAEISKEGEEDTTRKKLYKIEVKGDNIEWVEKAFEILKSKFNIYDDESKLTSMCMEFVSTHATKDTGAEDLILSYMRMWERQLGVNIKVTSKDNSETIYETELEENEEAQ